MNWFRWDTMRGPHRPSLQASQKTAQSSTGTIFATMWILRAKLAASYLKSTVGSNLANQLH